MMLSYNRDSHKTTELVNYSERIAEKMPSTKHCLLYLCYCVATITIGDGRPPPPRPQPHPSMPMPTDSTTPTTATPTVREEEVNQGLQVHLHGGDIVLTPEQQATLEATSNLNDPFSPQNAVVRNEQSLWSNGVIYYIFDNSLNQAAINAINEAMDAYSEQTCISFRERQNEEDYVRFYSGNGCFSYIGRVTGQQDISIGQGCEYQGVVIHEIFHALGRWHEQSRPDRDLYIRINDENIQSGVESNFEKVSSAFATTQSVPYDYGSIMHYSAHAFSNNGNPTIEPLNANTPLSALGQRNGLSTLDLQHVNALYCDESVIATWGQWESWSTCSRTCNGGTRTRIRSCIGGNDCSGSNIDIEQCNTEACEEIATWGEWSSWSGCSVTCGGGRRSRRRSCSNGNTCIGRMAAFEDCNTDICPQSSSWSSWGSWSDCSATCQGGTRFRRRSCQNGNLCEGGNIGTEYCNSDVPCTQGPAVEEWSEWSECTASCGGGLRFRTRQCNHNGTGCETEDQECNTQECNPEPQLRGLQHIGCYYVPVYSTSLFSLEGVTADLSDTAFLRTEPIRKCGTAAQLLGFTIFGISRGYCISGSNDVRDYQAYPSRFCQGGEGGVYARWPLMDVYQIINNEGFQDSVAHILSSNQTVNTTTTTYTHSILPTSTAVTAAVTPSTVITTPSSGIPISTTIMITSSVPSSVTPTVQPTPTNGAEPHHLYYVSLYLFSISVVIVLHFA